jgi:hypothetical protein
MYELRRVPKDQPRNFHSLIDAVNDVVARNNLCESRDFVKRMIDRYYFGLLPERWEQMMYVFFHYIGIGKQDNLETRRKANMAAYYLCERKMQEGNLYIKPPPVPVPFSWEGDKFYTPDSEVKTKRKSKKTKTKKTAKRKQKSKKTKTKTKKKKKKKSK